MQQPSWLGRLFGPKRELRAAAHVDPASLAVELAGGEALQPPLRLGAHTLPGRAELGAVKERIHE
jgi:hypothetical protein